MASHLQDDGFHEIQLNGKQLVFLFMAATVVSVVIFLCGVLVGRGVRTERAASAEIAAVNAGEPLPQPAPAPAATPAASAPAGSDPRTAAPPTPADDLSYFNRLEKSNGAQEDLKAKPSTPEKTTAQDKPAAQEKPAAQDKPKAVASAKPAAPATAPPTPAPAASAPAARTTAPDRTAAPPAPVATETPAPRSEEVPAVPTGSGFTVQVAALNVRTEADAIAKRLSAKGYAAYVLTGGGSPQVFRVRVGKFPTRHEAESVATRLQKEEQFKPWITR